eukprot:CAMPEP_0183456154 /NCGR_PEP_ID=MMETSP0370-20130417/128266_1 /TAXON_ID=268820 /ORGANISM="Peridinium aciculiferum, Strain PAER-2" /LENGTH=36 /DNA_ID= /DNA_START= /DNA_END= /DNA_ORIENTATION=
MILCNDGCIQKPGVVQGGTGAKHRVPSQTSAMQEQR